MMDSQRKQKFNRPALKSLHTNTVLSNVNFQDESAVTSPIKFRVSENKKDIIAWCDYESAETLPSDWLTDFAKYSSNRSRSSSVSRNYYATMDETLPKASFLSHVDESSRGSDSGLGSETYRSKCRAENLTDINSRDSSSSNSTLERFSTRSTSLSTVNCDSLDVDDGFCEEENKENVFLKKIMSDEKRQCKPRMGLGSKCEKSGSPFTLHRRHSMINRSPSATNHINTELSSQPVVSVRLGKRPQIDENESFCSPHVSVSTTPKRRKSIGKPLTLRRSLSGYPSLDMCSNLTLSRQPSHIKLTPTKNVPEVNNGPDMIESPVLFRSHSEIPDIPRIDEKKVERVIEAIDNFSLVGNSVSTHLLPTLDRHRFELVSVQAEDVASVLMEKKTNDVLMIDCRYPYEYNGGHVVGSINLHTEEQIMDELFLPALDRTTHEEDNCFRLGSHDSINRDQRPVDDTETKSVLHSPLKCAKNHVNQSRILIFYCEFSSRRAPTLAKFLRGADRKANLLKYPYLFYPEIYIMAGGYHNFVQHYDHLCEPQGYVKMFDKSYAAELSKYKRKARKLKINDRLFKKSPTLHGISPLRLLTNEENRPHSSPPSPPRAIIWS